jgi:hypothetical protein
VSIHCRHGGLVIADMVISHCRHGGLVIADMAEHERQKEFEIVVT